MFKTRTKCDHTCCCFIKFHEIAKLFQLKPPQTFRRISVIVLLASIWTVPTSRIGGTHWRCEESSHVEYQTSALDFIITRDVEVLDSGLRQGVGEVAKVDEVDEIDEVAEVSEVADVA